MDQIAVISDIHGNLPALSAVLEDIDRRGIERIICLGDLIGKGPSGADVVDICVARCEVIVQGNWDRLVAEGTNEHPLIRWPREQLGVTRIATLHALPFAAQLTLSSQMIRLFHASPFSVFHRVFQSDPNEKQIAMFESTDLTGYGCSPDVVAYGDIHTAYLRSFGSRTLLNVGSVGNPLDRTQATYAVLEGNSGAQTGPLSVAIVRVPYDIERAIAEAAASGMPDLDAYARELRTATYRGTPD